MSCERVKDRASMDREESLPMSTTTLDKKDPEYVAAVVKQLPQRDDSQDQRIIRVIHDELVTTPWARTSFDTVRKGQINYLRDMLAHIDEPTYIHQATQEQLAIISNILKSHIVEGQEILERLPKEQPVLIATNHLGTFKEGAIDPHKELGVDIPGFDLMFPYPLYAAPLYPIAKALDDNLYYIGFEFPIEFGRIFESAGFVSIRPPLPGIESSRTQELTDSIRENIASRPNTAIIHFPEGGTSGKRNEKGPYDLGEYRKGIFVVAASLNLPILPVAQRFHPDRGFELGVFEPVRLTPETSKDGFERIAQSVRDTHQAWLNQRKST